MATASVNARTRLRRWLRFSLRTFLLSVTALCVVLGMYVKQRRDQQSAIATVKRWGGSICLVDEYEQSLEVLNYRAGFPTAKSWRQPQSAPTYVRITAFPSTSQTSPVTQFTFTSLPGPAWARRWLGDYFFADVAAVDLNSYATEHLNLRPLSHMPKLKWLNLGHMSVRDDDLPPLQALRSLECLHLGDTYVTDAGLPHLASLGKLKVLMLTNTAVTETGVQTLRQALPNCTIQHGPTNSEFWWSK